MHMNKENLCNLHEQNEATGVDSHQVERAIDACLASDNQESDIHNARDLLE